MKNVVILLGVAAMTAVGCVTSENIDLSMSGAAGHSSGAAGQTSTAGQAGTSGGNAGTSGGNTSGAAGTTGAAGTQGTAGTSATAGSSGNAGTSGGQGGTTSTMDAGAPDTKMTSLDARTSMDASGGDASPYSATWTDIYNKMLNNMAYASNCTGGGCHNPGTQKGLDFSTQAKGYTTVKAKLVVGNPTASAIISQLTSAKMPQGRPKMPVADLNVIKAWITAGALNN